MAAGAAVALASGQHGSQVGHEVDEGAGSAQLAEASAEVHESAEPMPSRASARPVSYAHSASYTYTYRYTYTQ